MAENLAYLPAVSPSSKGTDLDQFYYVYGYEGTSVSDAKADPNYSTYGVLYNWIAAQEICPYGWHLPSNILWDVLLNHLGAGAGQALKSTYLWTSHGNGNNSTGFNAIPGGGRYQTGFFDLGSDAQFWTTSLGPGTTAYYRGLSYDFNEMYRSNSYRKAGLSVRCLKD